MEKNFFLVLMIFSLIFFAFGCATINSTSSRLMPSEGSPSLWWKDYESAFNSYKKIEVGKTDLAELKELRFDPDKMPKTTFLSSLTVRKMLLGAGTDATLRLEDLPPDMQVYLKDFGNIKGFKFEDKVMNTKGRGSLIKRWLKFKKEKLTTGWHFEMYVFMKRDVVAYTFWEGTPNIKDPKFEKDPLGFFSDILGNIPGIIIKRIDAN